LFLDAGGLQSRAGGWRGLSRAECRLTSGWVFGGAPLQRLGAEAFPSYWQSKLKRPARRASPWPSRAGSRCRELLPSVKETEDEFRIFC